MTAPPPVAFVRTHTRPTALAHVPEVRLRIADDVYELWEAARRRSGLPQVPPPFWAFAWAGGQALARYVLDHPELVTGRHVLDLASGSGLVAIAAARAGAARVTASEVDRLGLAAIGLNAAANGVRIARTRTDLLDDPGCAADVLLAGDVFYERPMADRVWPFLDRARSHGTAVLVGDPGREYLPRARFETLADYDVPVPPALEATGIKRTAVLRPG